MAALESCPKYNMVAYLEKTDWNAKFHEIIDFLTRSLIHYALTVSPVVSTTFVEQFWMTAKSKTINNVRYITATVAGKPVSISEVSIRSHLQFNDAVGIDVLPNQAIFDTIQLMGYEGDLNTLTFNKGLFSPQWKFLFHTIIHYLSSKSTSWDQIPTNIATAVICLATNQVYNFSKLIFDGMMRYLDAKKKFVMYPRFILVFLTNQLKNVPVPLDHFPINALTTTVFSFIVKKGKKNSGNVTPLFPSMLAQPTEDEGEVSERPSKTQPTPSPTHPSEDQSEPQPDPFLRPSSSNQIHDFIPEGSGGNHGGQSSSDRSLSGNEDGLILQSVYDLCFSLCTQVTTQAAQIKDLKAQIKQLKKKANLLSHTIMLGLRRRKPAKSEPTVHKDQAFDDLNDIVDDAMDYMETGDTQDKGRTSSKTLELSLSGDTVVLEEKESAEKGVSTEVPDSTNKPKVSTDKDDEGTAEIKVSTDIQVEGTAEIKDQVSDESATPTMTSTPTPTVFGDDETIAQVLITMSQNKPLPKIDLKAKGKKKIEEEDESDTESEDITEDEKKFKMLANDEEIARKVQEEWEAKEEKKKLAEEEATKAAFTNEYDFIQARLNADKILAEKLQEEEREKFTIGQRAKFLHDTIAAQRRLLAQQRSEAIRNKLPIRNQLRNQMMTYLKTNENFIPIGSAKDEKLIEKINKKAAGKDKEEVFEEPESTKVKAKIEEPKENIRKRSGRRLKMKAPKRSKRKKTDSNHEEENHLRTFLKIVPEEEENINYEVLGTSKELASPGSNSSWFSIHLVVYNEEMDIPEQTATGKGISNPLMAGSLPKTTNST
ncbi:hypothetical protein Tco_0686298 [Tanacetum coccineum]